MAAALRVRLQKGHGGDEVFGHFGPITLALKSPAVVIVAGVAAERCEGIRRQGQKAGNPRPPCDVLDMRVEPPVLVDDHHPGQIAAGVCRPSEIPAHRPAPLGRRVVDVFGPQTRIICRDLLRLGVLGAQVFEDSRGR